MSVPSPATQPAREEKASFTLRGGCRLRRRHSLPRGTSSVASAHGYRGVTANGSKKRSLPSTCAVLNLVSPGEVVWGHPACPLVCWPEGLGTPLCAPPCRPQTVSSG